MKSKNATVFVCQSCGTQSHKWAGQCRECSEWNTLVEENLKTVELVQKAQREGRTAAAIAEAVPIYSENEETTQNLKRVPTGFSEVDRVLGGGIVPGSLNLFGGEPGIGKSTLLLQIAANLVHDGKTVIYISGEESLNQVASRAKRMGFKNLDKLSFLSTTELELALSSVEKLKPSLAIIDSVQTLASNSIDSSSGTVTQVRAVTIEFMKVAKSRGITVVLVGHVTKEGTVAGPRLLEHMVDGVFYFEISSGHGFRLLRGQKNRFGATHEVAVFEMTALGLKQIENPSERFLAERTLDMPGSSVVAQLEGSRPLMTEFQALCQKCYVGFPKRTVQGVDANRVSVLLAVIEKTLGLSFSDQEVYCKVASGHKITEPAADLAMLMSLVSAVEYRALPADTLFLGEVGLGGELRSFAAVQSRLTEAKSVGMKKAVIPKWLMKEAKEIKGIEIIPVQNVKEAYQFTWKNQKVAGYETPEKKQNLKSESAVPGYKPARASEFDQEADIDF